MALLMGREKVFAEDRIAFLHVRFDSLGVSLRSVNVVSGLLKSNRAQADRDLSFEVKDKDGTVLYTGSTEDPRVLVREYFQEDGKIGRTTEERPSGVAIIRIPFDVRGVSMAFKQSEKSTAQKPLPLGTIRFDLSAYGKDK